MGHELVDFVDELQCGESWEIFHLNFIGSPSIVSKVLYCGESSNQLNFLPKQNLMLGSDSPFQDKTQNLSEIRKPLHARD